MSEDIRVEVAYARPDRQILVELIVPAGTTAIAAIGKSRITEQFPEIDLAQHRIGIFGKLTKSDTILRDRDRVEIYRPLLADPKEIRRKRAEEGKAPGKSGDELELPEK